MSALSEIWLRIQSALILGALTLFALCYHPDSFTMLLLIASFIALKEWRTLNPARSIRFMLLTTCYTLAAIISLWWLRQTPLPLMIITAVSYSYVLALFITVWSADIAGYTFGKLIGGPKCWPSISPGKTWAGTIAALLCGTAVCTAFMQEFTGIKATGFLLALGAVTSLAAIGGDALESYLKRKAGVKNSGTLLPGHGGLLDRIDALMAAAPVFASGIYVYLSVWA